MKRIATIQDISCFGKCSITVSLPIVSAMGVECCIVPTSLLSTHTGGFTGYTFRDLSDEILPIAEHWKSIDLSLDAIYTGYLGSKRQIDLVKSFIGMTAKPSTMIFVDPAMADNGVLYKGFDGDFPAKMLELCACADVVCPNITEAALLLGMPYRKAGEYGENYIHSLIDGFVKLGVKTVVITGVKYGDGKHGAVAYSEKDGSYVSYFTDDIPKSFHGTGDTFSSVLCGALVRGAGVYDAIKCAADFTVACIEMTMPDINNHPYGVKFEPCLPQLCEMVQRFDEE